VANVIKTQLVFEINSIFDGLYKLLASFYVFCQTPLSAFKTQGFIIALAEKIKALCRSMAKQPGVCIS